MALSKAAVGAGIVFHGGSVWIMAAYSYILSFVAFLVWHLECMPQKYYPNLLSGWVARVMERAGINSRPGIRLRAHSWAHVRVVTCLMH